jgi:hypothetical protein
MQLPLGFKGLNSPDNLNFFFFAFTTAYVTYQQMKWGDERQWSLVSWDVAPCSHTEVDRRFRGAYYLHEGDDGSSMHL